MRDKESRGDFTYLVTQFCLKYWKAQWAGHAMIRLHLVQRYSRLRLNHFSQIAAVERSQGPDAGTYQRTPSGRKPSPRQPQSGQ
jgi:hypothetical protein